MRFFTGKQLGLLAIPLLLLVSTVAPKAVEVTGLYEIELVANSQSATDREMAIKQALYGVLNRVLVAEDISTLPVVQQVLNGAEHYVKEFQYSLIAADTFSENDARLIRVQFDQDQLMEVMRKSQVGIWSEIRPQTLIWLVVDKDGSRQFFNPETMPDVDNAIALAAKLKGLPVIFPMLDLEEQQRISVSEVLGADSRNLLSVSARYEVPSVMAGSIKQSDQCWRGEWAFYFDGKIKQWSSECLPLKATLVKGLEGAFNVLSRYYGVKP